MKIKQRLEDFRVRELLRADYVTAAGEWRVYRVTKKKMTSMEAAAVLAREAGVPPGDVFMAGFKDRQGITTQHMAIHHGREVLVAGRDLKLESIGFAERELSSRESEGNAFEVVVRGLDRTDLTMLRANLQAVRDDGVINYFDEQRFGNLRHGQGWIALDLLRGHPEQALKMLIATPSVADDPKTKAFRTALHHAWGNWGECRDIAGRFGQHHSVFEHLKKNPDDFAGSFYHLASRLRLIHLYAYQSHLWNRAVANLVRARTERNERLVVESEEGPLLYPVPRAKIAELGETFRLPGPRLEDVAHPEQRRALEEVLAHDQIAAADFDIRGVSGFQLKGEDRALFVVPGHLRIRPAEPDDENPPYSLVKLRFDLTRGAYATLVVRRLLARPLGERDVSEGELGEIAPPEHGPAPRERDDFGRGYDNRERGPRSDSRGGGERRQGSRSDDRGQRPYRPRSDDRGPGSYRPSSDDRGQRPYRPRSDDRGPSSYRPSSDDRGQRPYRPRPDDRGPGSYRPSSEDRGQRSYRPRSDDRGPGSYRPSSDDRGQRPYRPRPDDRGPSSYRPSSEDRGQRPYRPRPDSAGGARGGERPYGRPYQGDRPVERRDDRGPSDDRPRPSGGDRGGPNRPFRGGGGFRPRGFGRGRDERSGGDRPLR